jgi:hypothetical protein
LLGTTLGREEVLDDDADDDDEEEEEEEEEDDEEEGEEDCSAEDTSDEDNDGGGGAGAGAVANDAQGSRVHVFLKQWLALVSSEILGHFTSETDTLGEATQTQTMDFGAPPPVMTVRTTCVLNRHLSLASPDCGESTESQDEHGASVNSPDNTRRDRLQHMVDDHFW